MKFYYAPLESITKAYLRNTHNKYYKGIDKYFIPFLVPNAYKKDNKVDKEINPLYNNIDTKLVPQIIANNATDTIRFINILKEYGYDEINLNFGCPSGTVTAKYRGAGILKDLNILDNYLDELFKNTDIKISAKIRIGFSDPNEFNNIIKILNKYPFIELIVHPRTALEMYKPNTLHLDKFNDICKDSKFDIIYNGDILNMDDINYIKETYPYIKGVMIGRGLLANPDLINPLEEKTKRQAILNYYDELVKPYAIIHGWSNTKFHMKEIWFYLKDYFELDKKTIKELFKENDSAIFNDLAHSILLNAKFKEIEGSFNRK